MKNHAQNTLELVPDRFLKSQNSAYESTISSFMQFAYVLFSSRGHQKILELMCQLLAFTLYKAIFNKEKEVWN